MLIAPIIYLSKSPRPLCRGAVILSTARTLISVTVFTSAAKTAVLNSLSAGDEPMSPFKTSNAVRGSYLTLCAAVALTLGAPPPLSAMPETVLHSVVSVLPVWPGKPQGGGGTPAGAAPEGSGVAIRPGGLIATAFHVVEPATRIDVRLADGRILPAELVGFDAASDIALLDIGVDLPVFELATDPQLADQACVVSNAYGLDLSVTCGVISAWNVSDAGFNQVEDFIQTDAAANPGSSGGALVDRDGRLYGMISAIFASGSETNIGVNFAVSSALLRRVVDDLADDGKVVYLSAGWGLEVPPREELTERAGVKVASLSETGIASGAGVKNGDLLLSVGGRKVTHPRDVLSALTLVSPGGELRVSLLRDGVEQSVVLSFEDTSEPENGRQAEATGTSGCPYAEPICDTRQAIFPVESFDPLASAVRIGKDLLVTNRHVVGNRLTATVFSPSGPLTGSVIPSAYEGDLALLQVEGLPENGLILDPEVAASLEGALFAVGADISRRQVRVFQPGELILPPADGALFGRLHVTSFMQPGVSGGALVDGSGKLAGIAVGGGQGRYEALPADDIQDLLALSEASNAKERQMQLGLALSNCVEILEAGASGNVNGIVAACSNALNYGQYLEAGRMLAQAGHFEEAVVQHQAAVDQVPNSLNARLSLLVSLQLAGRFQDMLPHAYFVRVQIPDDLQALRFAIQAGVWGNDPALAETAYQKMLEVDPSQAEAARRFIDAPPPAPGPR